VRQGTEPAELLVAMANLCSGGSGRDRQHPKRMVRLLVDGLRYGAGETE
jgi:hypothetical protein